LINKKNSASEEADFFCQGIEHRAESVGNMGEGVAHCELRIVNCFSPFPIANCALRIAHCELFFAVPDCELHIANCELQFVRRTNIIHHPSSANCSFLRLLCAERQTFLLSATFFALNIDKRRFLWYNIRIEKF